MYHQKGSSSGDEEFNGRVEGKIYTENNGSETQVLGCPLNVQSILGWWFLFLPFLWEMLGASMKTNRINIDLGCSAIPCHEPSWGKTLIWADKIVQIIPYSPA